MKRETKVGLAGREIEVWIPESDADRAELAAKAEAAGEIDTNASFGDQPEKRRRLARLVKLARRLRERRARP